MSNAILRHRTALFAALPLTLPVLAGFLFLGIAYGVLMHAIGLGAIWTFFASTVIFAGSMQYVALTMFVTAFDPIRAFLMSVMVNARHIFYGLSMLDRMRGAGWYKPYIAFALCDETFSIISGTNPPKGVDPTLFMFYTALLNHCYWVLGSAAGALAGDVITFSTEGLDFALTALFVVIFIDGLKKNREGAFIGLGCSALCLAVFGNGFIVPSMLFMLAVLSFVQRRKSSADQ